MTLTLFHAAAGLPASASDDALERCGAGGSVGELAIHAHAGEDSMAPAAPGLGRSSAPPDAAVLACTFPPLAAV